VVRAVTAPRTDRDASAEPAAPPERQLARRVLMIRPAAFGPNAETAPTNAFQSTALAASPAVQERALAEFDDLVALLRAHGVEVCVVDDDPATATPDAIFPNNWVSFHADGTVVRYPMCAPNRRLERRAEVIAEVCARLGVAALREVDLAAELEPRERFLEGTGSLLLDRPGRVAYACLSPRTHPDALAEFGRRLGYAVHAFHAVDERGRAIYHTNVLMALGERFCVLCTEAVRDAEERAALVARLTAGGRELVAIDPAQMRAFAGNLLQLENAAGERIVVGSTRALGALSAEQRAALERHGALVAAPLETIESVGGGGVRCMLAEVFLPPAAR